PLRLVTFSRSPLWGRAAPHVLARPPSPLGGGVGGGGRRLKKRSCVTAPPPSPALPHKGGGSRPSWPHALVPVQTSTLPMIASIAPSAPGFSSRWRCSSGRTSPRRREFCSRAHGLRRWRT